MFGKNKQYRVSDFIEESKIAIRKIFYTIQGEGIYSGKASIFIRFGHCSLACEFCDTEFENNIVKLTVEEIYEKVMEVKPEFCNLIIITGGEPLLQPKSADLINFLLDKGFVVQIETAGTHFPNGLNVGHPNLTIICSPKTGKLNQELEKHISHYKYIISSRNVSDVDGLPIIYTNNSKVRVSRPSKDFTGTIYISPMDEYDKKLDKRNLQLVTKIAMQYGYTISLQTHKILNVE